jgi:hypothetical protein
VGFGIIVQKDFNLIELYLDESEAEGLSSFRIDGAW